MRRYPGEIEADLLEFFNIDLLDMYRGTLSVRRVHVLVHRLLKMAGRSALSSAVNSSAEWSNTEHLLAALVDEVAVTNYMYQQVNFKGDAPVPEPVKRPESSDSHVGAPSENVKKTRKVSKKEFASPEKVASVFASLQF